MTKISVTSREVNVIFTVTDKRGKFIRNLQQKDFTVTDNKQPVPDIRGFTSETDLPLRVGLLIDASNSIRDKFKFEQEAAIIFLNDILRPRTDYAFIVGFDTVAEVTQDWTNSNEKLSAGVRMIRPGGGTALYDAIYQICRDRIAKRSENVPVRRAIILLTDGYDNQSRVTLTEAIEMAQKAEVIIYTISTKFDNSEDKGDKVLKKISEETGGRTFHPLRVEAVSDAFRDIQEELRSQYALAYRPPNLVADGTFHEIDIDVKKNKKFKVRARRGYYAPRAQ
jgi:VWFA-related protein